MDIYACTDKIIKGCVAIISKLIQYILSDNHDRWMCNEFIFKLESYMGDLLKTSLKGDDIGIYYIFYLIFLIETQEFIYWTSISARTEGLATLRTRPSTTKYLLSMVELVQTSEHGTLSKLFE